MGVALHNCEACFLSRLRKAETLAPVITILINWSPVPWQGYGSVRELAGIGDNHPLAPYMSDAKLNIIEPSLMEEEDFARFRTELGAIMKLVRHLGDRNAVTKVIREDEVFRSVSPEGVELVNTLTGLRMPVEAKTEGGNINMTNALLEYVRESEKIAFDKGEKSGFDKGEKSGFDKGEKSGFDKGEKSGIDKLMDLTQSVIQYSQKNRVPYLTALQKMELTREEKEKYRKFIAMLEKGTN